MQENLETKNNNFKFVIEQNGSVVTERIFSADVFNPIIRYSVDIRDIIPSITQKLQEIMSSNDLTYQTHGYDLVENYENLVDYYNVSENKLVVPKYVKYTHKNKKIRGVECKFGLYMNNNPIVERKVYVDNYNPKSRFSQEIVDFTNEVVDEIHNSLKTLDEEQMWGDYILINTFGLFQNQIRELSKEKRKEMIDNYSNKKYLKKYRSLTKIED